MTEAKYVGNISRTACDNRSDFVPRNYSYYNSYKRMKNAKKKAARQRRIFLSVLVFAVIFTVILFHGSSAFGNESADTELYSVLPGDTLWSIAHEYKPANLTMDEYLYKLRKVNSLSTSEIYAGDLIIIPE